VARDSSMTFTTRKEELYPMQNASNKYQ